MSRCIGHAQCSPLHVHYSLTSAIEQRSGAEQAAIDAAKANFDIAPASTRLGEGNATTDSDQAARSGRQQTSLTGALCDEMIDLRFVEASWINPDLVEESFNLQADDPMHPGPGKKSDAQHPGIMG